MADEISKKLAPPWILQNHFIVDTHPSGIRYEE